MEDSISDQVNTRIVIPGGGVDLEVVDSVGVVLVVVEDLAVVAVDLGVVVRQVGGKK